MLIYIGVWPNKVIYLNNYNCQSETTILFNQNASYLQDEKRDKNLLAFNIMFILNHINIDKLIRAEGVSPTKPLSSMSNLILHNLKQ